MIRKDKAILQALKYIIERIHKASKEIKYPKVYYDIEGLLEEDK